jgi:Glyceraldehyde-3-phosphate dehydrogenase/erythrose-4-phosphate dehydrogenase
MTTVAINGFGRIGRSFFKMALNHPDFTISAINDLSPLANLAYLLRYDTAYGTSGLAVEVEGDSLRVNGKRIAFSQERNPEALPWGTLGIDVVVEATGAFASYEKAKAHLTAGAKRVVITAPVKDEAAASDVAGATVLMGVNDDALTTAQISSNASCTTNATSSTCRHF